MTGDQRQGDWCSRNHLVESRPPPPRRNSALAAAAQPTNSPGSDPVVAVRGLAHRYPGRVSAALEGLDFDVPKGALAGLIGPNGAGKSTLISILTGVLKVQSGTVRVAGRTPGRDRWLQQVSSLVPQALAFYGELTGRENLRFFASVHGLSQAEYQRHLADAVDVTRLAEVLDERADTYSGGLQRRLNLALGLINRPQILYLDEPTVGVDAVSRRYLLEAIARLRERDTTIVYTSHYMEEVEDLCDRLTVVDRGHVVAAGATDELLERFGRVTLEVAFTNAPGDDLVQRLQGWPLQWRDAYTLVVTPASRADLGPFVETLETSGATVERLRYGAERLADVYLRLINRGHEP